MDPSDQLMLCDPPHWNGPALNELGIQTTRPSEVEYFHGGVHESADAGDADATTIGSAETSKTRTDARRFICPPRMLCFDSFDPIDRDNSSAGSRQLAARMSTTKTRSALGGMSAPWP
ncbi:hypothetical protein GCM10011584_26890 [Nocardioides phosphati]|uniref:Uncharacterized protein n=1 Tax=Nocardioides phosphati TaxID=1867775 RepID=A0ABQ2NBQ8_9ACTN|nr:hypothetical protein GCM10011584_26890 [Nocardioides phosphati]